MANHFATLDSCILRTRRRAGGGGLIASLLWGFLIPASTVVGMGPVMARESGVGRRQASVWSLCGLADGSCSPVLGFLLAGESRVGTG